MKREEDIRSEHSVRLSPPSEGLGEVLTFLVLVHPTEYLY